MCVASPSFGQSTYFVAHEPKLKYRQPKVGFSICIFIINKGINNLSWNIYILLGSLVCERVGPIFLGPKLVTIKKINKNRKRLKKEKQREEKRKRKNTSHCPDFIKELISLHMWSNRVEIWRRGSKLKQLQSERWRSYFELGNWYYCP